MAEHDALVLTVPVEHPSSTLRHVHQDLEKQCWRRMFTLGLGGVAIFMYLTIKHGVEAPISKHITTFSLI
jgi:hypothetical protein